MTKVLIFGCGFSGQAIAKAFAAEGASVWGTTRSQDKAEKLEKHGIRALLFDGHRFSSSVIEAMATATIMIQSISPGEQGDPVLALGHEQLRNVMPLLQWTGYLSTIGVYGNHDGDWVSEDTPCRPVSARSKERLQAEAGWTEFAASSGCPTAILRLSGIYGPGRNVFCNLARGTARRLIKKNQVFNRIRVEDIAGASLFLAQHGLGGIYNVTDDNPAPPQDVIVEAARLMGIEPPPEQPFETADLTPMALSFYGENKRVSNAKLKAAGYAFAYPDYSGSLAQLWERNLWRDGIVIE